MSMLGNRLKMIRKEKGLSQKELADLIGTSQGYISDIEMSKKAPGSEFLKALKQFLKIDLNWYLTGVSDDPGTIINPISIQIDRLLEGMDKDSQQDVLRYATEKKLLFDLMKEKRVPVNIKPIKG